jgi:hypothetical protein
MRVVLLTIILTGCQFEIDHNHQGLEGVIPEQFTSNSDVNFQPGFDAVYRYCEGNVDHDIAIEKRIDPYYVVSEEDRQFSIDDCYYNFDFSSLEVLSGVQ